jgi:hypothetical protein
MFVDSTQRAAMSKSLVRSAKPNGHDPWAYLSMPTDANDSHTATTIPGGSVRA